MGNLVHFINLVHNLALIVGFLYSRYCTECHCMKMSKRLNLKAHRLLVVSLDLTCYFLFFFLHMFYCRIWGKEELLY